MKKNGIKISKKEIQYFITALISLSILFILIQEPQTGADTATYIAMNGEVPPIYPLFLLFLRNIFGVNIYLYVVVVIQTILAAFSVTLLCNLIYRVFHVNRVGEVVIFAGMLSTYFKVDEYSVNCNLWILTEGLSYSLFFLFVYFSILFLTDWTWKNFCKLMFSTIILMMCRAQFLVCFVMVVLYCLYLFFRKKINIKYAVLCFAGICIGYMLVGIGQNGYKAFVDYQEKWPITERALVKHLIHYAVPEDANLIEDKVARQVFLKQQTAMVENGYNYREGENWLIQIERYKDGFEKYGHIYNDIIDEYIKEQGIKQESEINAVYASIIHSQLQVLDKYIGKWIVTSAKQFPATLARGIFLYYPPLGIACIVYVTIAYSVYVGLNLALIVKKKTLQKENVFCLFVLLFTVGNGIYSQTTVVSIMRYVAYSHGIFYVSGLLILLALFQKNKFRKVPNEDVSDYSSL